MTDMKRIAVAGYYLNLKFWEPISKNKTAAFFRLNQYKINNLGSIFEKK